MTGVIVGDDVRPACQQHGIRPVRFSLLGPWRLLARGQAHMGNG